MDGYVSVSEAASYLGVSAATLRNWDRAGTLKAMRHPNNNYRVYELKDLQGLREQQAEYVPSAPESAMHASAAPDARAIRGLINRLQNILRDTGSYSNLIERFDELNKLLFLKLSSEQSEPGLLDLRSGESRNRYVQRIREAYARLARRGISTVPIAHSILKANGEAVYQASQALADVSFRNLSFDVKGLAYEEVIRNTFDKSENQQFFTPANIVKFIVSMLGGRLQGAICDPAAGTGGFLIEVAKSGAAYRSLTALEIDERLSWVTGMNLLTHGASNAVVRWFPNTGSLGTDVEPLFESFDAIITNPPFGSDCNDRALLEEFSLGTRRTSRRRGILFLERCHQLLKRGGALGFIIDEGVLSGSNTEDVRQFIHRHFLIDAIVSLPETSFMPYAAVNASILFLRKRDASEEQGPVFFGRAENVGRKSNGDDDLIYGATGAGRLNSDLPNIFEQYLRFRATGQIEDSDQVYLAHPSNDGGGGSRLDFRYHHPAREHSRSLLAHARAPLVPLAELCEERNELTIPAKELTDQTILYTGLANIESDNGIAHQVPTPANALKSAVKRYEPGEILFAKMRPNLRKVAWMNVGQPGFASPECTVLVPRRDEHGEPLIDPALLAVLLRSELVYGQIMHLVAGIGRPRISGKELRRVLIPRIDKTAQLRTKAQHTAEMEAAASLRAKAAELLQDALEMERRSVERLAHEFAA